MRMLMKKLLDLCYIPNGTPEVVGDLLQETTWHVPSSMEREGNRGCLLVFHRSSNLQYIFKQLRLCILSSEIIALSLLTVLCPTIHSGHCPYPIVTHLRRAPLQQLFSNINNSDRFTSFLNNHCFWYSITRRCVHTQEWEPEIYRWNHNI